MRLAILTPVFPPYRGGTGTVAFDNARMAADAGITTTVFTPYYKSIRGACAPQEDISGMSVERVKPVFSIGNAGFIPQLFWKLRQFTVIHAHYPCIGLELPTLFWRCLGKRVVMTYHFDLIGKTSLRKFLFMLTTRIMMPLMIRASDVVFVSSFDYVEHSPLVSRYFKKYRKKFSELPNSVDESLYMPAGPKKVSGHLGSFTADVDVILFVGGLDSAHYFKGVDVLLTAAREVLQRFPHTRFVFVGDGDLRAGYEEYAHRLGIADSTYFVGSINREELPSYYRRATCVVLPSVDSTEAFGVVLIEAGACGKPSIATNLRGVRSVIDDQVTGTLVEPNDSDALAKKICEILEDPEHAKTMGGAARKRVDERYSYAVVGRKYVQEIHLISNSPKV